ncbi:hypothetical protein G7Z17_g3946 [Cylindrodendrum hubeiense]|uniref:Major facilitator superfamily (MFS) profile domain-containing protein n=1 Tax=Cylindrodendrum hubeiense TaxID=595255 RepID=A0A9P5HDP7_9HYPO|nr:hypothetical protein G7Z17_g3946 [Cylindrodendrum hubeiense]
MSDAITSQSERLAEPEPKPALNGEQQQDLEEDAEAWQANRQVVMIMVCLITVTLVVAIDATILVPAFPTISNALQGTTSETFWAGTSYLLTSSTFQPLIGALSGVIGRREMFITTIVLFTAGTLIACLAQDFTTLLAGRTVQGIGGGGIITLNLIIITDMVPLQQRPKYFGVSLVSVSAGMIAGPLIGGAIAQEATWRLLFYINFPFCAIGLATAPWVIRLGPRQPLRLKKLRTEIDWIGLVLFLASTTVFLIAITWAGHDYAWNSYETLCPLLLGTAGIVATVIWESRYAKTPFIRREMLYSRPLMTVYGCTLLQGLLMYAHVLYLALWLIGIKGRTPLMTGVALLPIFGGMIVASISIGFAVSRIGHWKWAVWLGWGIQTLAAGLLILLDPETTTAEWAIIFVVLGLGQGALLISHNLAVQGIARPADVAYATALFAFTRSVGFCLGLAVGDAILENKLSLLLNDAGLPASIAENAESYVFKFFEDQEGDALRSQVLSLFGEAATFLFQVMTGISGGGLLLSLTIRGDFSLRKASTQRTGQDH